MSLINPFWGLFHVYKLLWQFCEGCMYEMEATMQLALFWTKFTPFIVSDTLLQHALYGLLRQRHQRCN